MVSEAFCPSCLRTVYTEGEHCPVCSALLIPTGHNVDVPAYQRDRSTDVDPSILPSDEEQRLDAVHRYEILDTPRDGSFDRITRLAARIFDVPIATVTIVDRDRIWFKSAIGLDAEQVDRDPGLCASAILADDPWIVEDARKDPRSLENPLVQGDLGVQFYAGVPLKTADGFNIGMLNVIDKKPRTLTEADVEILTELGQVVVDELELRLAARRLYKHLARSDEPALN